MRVAEFRGGDNVDDDDLTVASATFGGAVDATSAQFRYTTFEGVHFRGLTRFESAAFDGKATFVDAETCAPQ